MGLNHSLIPRESMRLLRMKGNLPMCLFYLSQHSQDRFLVTLYETAESEWPEVTSPSCCLPLNFHWQQIFKSIAECSALIFHVNETPWNKVLPEKPTVVRLVIDFLVFEMNRRLNENGGLLQSDAMQSGRYLTTFMRNLLLASHQP
jgi:hypothetical protein